MRRLLTKTLLLLALWGVAWRASAFSLLGPYAIEVGGGVWQVERIGYNLPGDIGGPMNAPAGEEYRWNTPNVFYAYDAAFLNFFGTRGVQEIEKAIKTLNDLPPASLLNVDDYPMTSERVNFRAAALGIHDLKSWTMSTILEEMGVAAPNRWVYCLRNRITGPTRFPVDFTVIRRNFDPITAAESPYINGRLWTYTDIFDLDNPARSFTINTTVDPLDFGRFEPVSGLGGVYTLFGPGSFYTSLTRDDVGAIKFIYQAANQNFEAVIPGSTNAGGFTGTTGGGGGPWSIPTTNVVTVPGGTATGFLFDPVLRLGVDKVNFVRAEYDSILGQFFAPITNVYVDRFVTNGVERSQGVLRAILVPDLLITAGDLNGPTSPPGFPVATVARTGTSGWQNDDAIGRGARRSGAGVIPPAVELLYNNVGFLTTDVVNNFTGNAVFGPFVLPFFIWGAFDGTTNEPVIFSQGGNITLQQLEQLRLGQ